MPHWSRTCQITLRRTVWQASGCIDASSSRRRPDQGGSFAGALGRLVGWPQEAGAAFRSPSFLAQQERLKEQEKKLSQQDEEIALLKARLDALEAAPRPPA